MSVQHDDQYFLDMVVAGAPEQGMAGLMAKYEKALERYAKRQLWKEKIPDLYYHSHNQSMAKDVADEVWGLLWILLDREPFRDASRLKNWLYATVHNIVRDIKRKREHEIWFEQDKPDETELDARLIRQAEQFDASKALEDLRLMNILSPCQRIAYIFRYGFGLPPRIIHHLMGTSTNTISVSLRHADARIQQRLQSHEYQLESFAQTQTGYRAEIYMHNKPSSELSKEMQAILDCQPGRRFTVVGKPHTILPVGIPFSVKHVYYITPIQFYMDYWGEYVTSHYHLFEVDLVDKNIEVIREFPVSMSFFESEQERDIWLSEKRAYAASGDSPDILSNDDRAIWSFYCLDHKTEKNIPSTMWKLEKIVRQQKSG